MLEVRSLWEKGADNPTYFRDIQTNRISAKEFLLNLYPDFIHPPFSPADFCLKFRYPLQRFEVA
jgi:hypothetical protein